MADSSYEVKEVRFVFEAELTQVYVLAEAHGDSPLGVQGWHHKTFPASQSADSILQENFHEFIMWPLKAPTKQGG